MENALGIVVFIGIIIVMIINLYIYHKVFDVVYFNLGGGLIKELILAWLAAMLEISLVGGLIKILFSGIFKLLGVVVKIVLIILALAAVAFIVWKIVQVIKGKTQTVAEAGTETMENVQTEMHGNTCANCGKVVVDNADFCNHCGAKLNNTNKV